jgi:glycosyltransferase involved in cell wall biosynthesis
VRLRRKSVRGEVKRLARENKQLRKEVRALRRLTVGEFRRVREILQFVLDDDRNNRDLLWQLRTSAGYEAAFVEAEPLISVIIPTFDRVKTLTEVSVPSVLVQTYKRFELIVVGDGAPAEVEAALREFHDPRLRYVNLGRRGNYPADPERRARVAGGVPFNHGVRLSKGLWLARLDDDDAYRPQALELLLAAAREHRWELCYGRFRELLPDGSERPGERGVNTGAAIYHAGLRFIETELADATFNHSSDKSMTRRMLNCGVRVGGIPDVIMDYDLLQLRHQRIREALSEP